MSQNPDPAASAPVDNQFVVVLGAVELEVTYRDGNTDKIKIQQLPVSFMNEWTAKVNDEPSLVELYCDKADPERTNNLLKLNREVMQLMRLQGEAKTPEEIRKLGEEISNAKAAMVEAQKVKRWADKLLPESHAEIVRIGRAINSPIFDRWMSDQDSAIGHLLEVYRKHNPDHPLVVEANKKATDLSSSSQTAV